MNEEFPFTKEYLRTLSRDDLIKLATTYSKIPVWKKYTNEEIIEKLWDKYYPDVLVCDGTRTAIPCERKINADGDEIIEYKGQIYNISRMSNRVRLIFEARMREGK